MGLTNSFIVFGWWSWGGRLNQWKPKPPHWPLFALQTVPRSITLPPSGVNLAGKGNELSCSFKADRIRKRFQWSNVSCLSGQNCYQQVRWFPLLFQVALFATTGTEKLSSELPGNSENQPQNVPLPTQKCIMSQYVVQFSPNSEDDFSVLLVRSFTL